MLKNITIAEFKELESVDEYEVYDEETGEWKSFAESCYAQTSGFPNIETANEEILLITNYNSLHNRYVVYLARDFDQKKVQEYLDANHMGDANVKFSIHQDEYHMLKAFLNDWATSYPDVVTGWNSNLFDIVYLVNRITRILGEEMAKRLSPWGIIKSRTIKINDDEVPAYDIIGINCLDYMDLMKKYTYSGRDSWKLDNVAEDELGRKKLPFDGSFKDHYTGEFERNEDPGPNATELQRKAHLRTMLRKEINRRGLT
jgi:DNA polymerase elongation subunit (family B)